MCKVIPRRINLCSLLSFEKARIEPSKGTVWASKKRIELVFTKYSTAGEIVNKTAPRKVVTFCFLEPCFRIAPIDRTKIQHNLSEEQGWCNCPLTLKNLN